jgi:uncharacterized protein
MDPTMGRVLGAGEDIVKLGRSRGLGATLVTQRPATINKNVLEQVESLLIFRLMGPNDRKAIKGWIEANCDPDITDKVMRSLAGLRQGEAWLYSPAFLGVLEGIAIRRRRTFDSSATPEVGAVVAEPTKRAPVDLDVLREQMAATIEKQRAADPVLLRKRIAQLERDLAAAGERDANPVIEVREVPVVSDELMAELRMVIERLDAIDGTVDTMLKLRAAADRLVSARESRPPDLPRSAPDRVAEIAARARREDRVPVYPVPKDSNGAPPASQRRLLDALAMLEQIGVSPADRKQLALGAAATLLGASI